ncbi:hypothetical protein FACS189421_06950 [Bacteroidia bacterium]|nr:hypothetical protein FACS189421_06950 [Bacteroidia bacterium]
MPATADLEYEYDESDVCWIDDVSGFSGFQPAADSTTDIVADTIVQMQAVDADLKQQLAASGATRQPTATAPTGNSGVQFGAFSTPAAAAEQAGAIKSKMGLTASIEPTSIGIYRVRVNNLTEPDAQKIKGECAKHKLDCYVF